MTPRSARRLFAGVGALLAIGLLFTFARAKAPPAEVRAESRILMDTAVTVTVAGADAPTLEKAVAGAFAALEAVDREMARNPGTPLWKLNEAGHGPVSPALAEVLASARAWGERSGGAFDPGVARLSDLWDIPSGPHAPPAPERIAAARPDNGWRRLALDGQNADLGGTVIDLGGIAKGYALDRAAAALRQAGVENFLVDAGGDLVVGGAKNGQPWRVGIQDPRNPEGLLRIVAPGQGALVTSGDYERAYEWEGVRYHHILDPRTGSPARGCQSVTIFAPTGMDADAAATAVFVLGPEAGLRLLESLPGFEGLVIDAQGRARETPGFSQKAPPAPPRAPAGGA